MNPRPRSGTPVFRFTRFLVAVVAALLIVPLAVHAQSVPNAPTGLTATPGDGQVTLSWDDPGDTTITGYQASSDDGTSYSVIGGSDANTINHTVDYLTNGTEYSFKVRAVNEAGTGAASAAANETPLIAAPKNLGAEVGDGQVTLGWDDPDNSSISRYQVSSNGGTSYSTISGSGASTTSHTVENLTNDGTGYIFAVRAVNGAAATVSATPTVTTVAVPAAPTDLTAEAGDTQVTLSWVDPGNTTITGYQVSSDDGTSYSGISGSDANTISHTVDDLTNGTKYSFKVRAVNEAGTGAPATVTATPLFKAPRNLGVTVGDGQVELHWADPGNDSIDSYEVSSDGGTTYSEISGSDEDTTSHTVTDLTNGTSYSFAVRAVNGGGGVCVGDAHGDECGSAGRAEQPAGLTRRRAGDAELGRSEQQQHQLRVEQRRGDDLQRDQQRRHQQQREHPQPHGDGPDQLDELLLCAAGGERSGHRSAGDAAAEVSERPASGVRASGVRAYVEAGKLHGHPPARKGGAELGGSHRHRGDPH